MATPEQKNSGRFTFLLWGAAGFLILAMLFARAVYPEVLWLTIIIGLPLIAVLGVLVQQNAAALRGRTAAYGLNSLITILLVIAIVGVVNFIGYRYPQKLDLTKNKTHTLSDQTFKLVKGLKTPVKAVLFAKMQGREQFRPLLDNYKQINPGKFEVEYVDPDREPTRAKQVGIKKYGTLQLVVGARENKLEEPTEEKVTNALIKLTKEKTPTLCTVTGHGEKNFSSTETDGYDTAKKALLNQAYEIKDLNIVQEGKIPDTCDAVAIVGPQKSFFDPEIKILREFLANGGHLFLALDINIKGGEYAPELAALLNTWNIKATSSMIVDPLSKMLGVDASVPILASFNKDQAITKDFQTNCYFPFSRPIEAAGNTAAGVNPVWLAQTTPKSWAVADMKELASGQVRFTEGKDRNGPLSVAMAIDGKLKDSKATKNTRLVVFGTSLFASNNYQRFGGNLDLFLNTISWIMEDESLISIRAKEDGPGKVELSQKQGTVIFLVTVVVLPLLISIAGIVIWILRRRL
ncbi:Gldg family protein [Bdellovibrionota bacterium FG-1]